MDLQSEHEKYLCRYFNKPVFVIDYPQELKAFYMKNNSDDKTVSCVDLLFPGVGELMGGSEREDNHEILKSKILKNKIDVESLRSYLNLRGYGGYAPSSGLGIGFERLLMIVSGTENIKDTICFPRYYRKL